MKAVSRRQFLKYCAGAAAALGLDLSTLARLERALAAGTTPKVIWLNGANCTGCTISLANRISSEGPADVADLLVNYIDLTFHANLMGAAGDAAVDIIHETASSGFILAVDGGIPTSFGGRSCILWSESGRDVTALEAVSLLAPKASAVLAIGTCASFGGIPSGSPNLTGIKAVADVAGVKTINIAGCPVHPDWLIGTVAQILAGARLELDSLRRPRLFFSRKVHENCPRKGRKGVKLFGSHGYCMNELGCKGKKTMADCPSRLWNGRTNWCIGADTVCLGCTEYGFPDSFSPFFRWSQDNKN